MKSTLFLHYLSCVDHAFINNRGQVIGGSYHPNFEVTGEIESQENVVIDFGAVKKQIKAALDHKELGLDHKLWIIPGFSECETHEVDDTINITTPACILSMPRNAVKIFEGRYTWCFSEAVEKEINTYITAELKKLHPDLDISVKTILTCDTFTQSQNYVMFRYSHGLKNSTSWGCQNHSHGHLSFIEFNYTNRTRVIDHTQPDLLRQSVNEMDDSIFIFAENIVKQSDEFVSIEYTTPRGLFTATYFLHSNKIQILQTETTIEYISEWYVNRNRKLLEDCGVVSVYVSEGLAKGAVVHL